MEMTDDDERSCCCQLMCDLLVNVGLLKPNIGMSTSLLNSRGDELQPDHSTAIPQQQAQEEASPVHPDYMLSLMSGRPSNSLDRRLIVQHARSLPSTLVQEQIVHQQPAAYIHEDQEPHYLDEPEPVPEPEPDILR